MIILSNRQNENVNFDFLIFTPTPHFSFDIKSASAHIMIKTCQICHKNNIPDPIVKRSLF